MRPIEPDSQGARIMAVLSEGPSMTGEVAAEVGLTSQRASAHLRHLYRTGRVARKEFDMGDRRTRFLWSLEGQGA